MLNDPRRVFVGYLTHLDFLSGNESGVKMKNILYLAMGKHQGNNLEKIGRNKYLRFSGILKCLNKGWKLSFSGKKRINNSSFA